MEHRIVEQVTLVVEDAMAVSWHERVEAAMKLLDEKKPSWRNAADARLLLFDSVRKATNPTGDALPLVKDICGTVSIAK